MSEKELLMTEAEKKEKALLEHLSGYRSLVVLLSGGVDSAYLLYAARQAAGGSVRAVTAISELHPEKEAAAARDFAEMLGVPHVFVDTRPLESPDFVENSRQRCYICKRGMFADAFAAVGCSDKQHWVHGANADDSADFRPGLQAAREMGVEAPLAMAGLSKTEIRELSKKAGLPTWNKPASGCLATRIPYGTEVTRDRLALIGKAEQFLHEQGFPDVRVRCHGDLAKIELPEAAMAEVMKPSCRGPIVAHFRQLGFLYVALDMEGYQSGRLNRRL